MAYVKNDWSVGDVITEVLIDHLETQYDEGKTDLDAHVINQAAGDGRHRWTANKFLKGAGAAAPTEIDLPFEFSVPCLRGTTKLAISYFEGYEIDAPAEVAYFQFTVPSDFNAITSAEVVAIVIVATVGVGFPMAADFDTEYGALDEAYNNHSEAITVQESVEGTSTINDLISWDVSGALTGIVAGDRVSLRVLYRVHLAGTRNDTNALFIEFRLKYS